MIFQKLKYFGRETINNLWQYRVRNIFSITIICLSFLILGVFLSLSNNLQFLAQQISQNMAVIIFLEKDISQAELEAIEESLDESTLVLKVRYVNSNDAITRFRDTFPDLKRIVDNLKANPFPSSFEATLKENLISSQETGAFISQMTGMPGVDDVQFNRDWVERMQAISRLVQAVGYFLGGILILASFLIISNIIKLNVFSRTDEIEILRFSGATNMFIRTPFLFEGIVLGMLGGMLSLLLLSILIQIFPVYLGSALGALNELVNFRFLTFSQCMAIIMGGAVIGVLGSLSSLSRFLKT